MAEPVGGRISEELRRVFEGAGLTQPELAKELGVSQSTVSDWARGARMPPVRAIAMVEDLAEVPKGTVLRRAGYIDDAAPTIEQAIKAAPYLNKFEREMMLTMYDIARRRETGDESVSRRRGASQRLPTRTR